MRTGKFVLICILAFIIAFVVSVLFKIKYTPKYLREYSVKFDDSVGTTVTDLSYGDKDANKFDLYLPADKSRKSYGLVVYLHAGGFTTGDKTDDKEILQWLCSKGYVAAGINYTLFSDDNPDANVYTQSEEIRDSIPYVVSAAKEYGYNINQMAISGGSAGGCLALLYAYRDADISPVPVKMCFEGVGPSSFYPEDWTNYGFDQEGSEEAATVLFSIMSGSEITADMIGTESYDEAIKNVSALLWVNENTVPTVMAYGKYDKMQSFNASLRLDEALTECNIEHEYVVFEHSGHGLQNDNKEYAKYMKYVEEYLDKYLPIE